jgi:hypothetical protein
LISFLLWECFRKNREYLLLKPPRYQGENSHCVSHLFSVDTPWHNGLTGIFAEICNILCTAEAFPKHHTTPSKVLAEVL